HAGPRHPPADRPGRRRAALQHGDHQVDPTGGESGLQGVDLHLRAKVERGDGVLLAVGRNPVEGLMTMKRGLPERKSMRHDLHFVEELTRRSGRQVGAMIPLELIEPNAEQPRTSLGNIEELAASIGEKGVLEPILVRSIGPNRYQIISGERRFRAATLAGLDEIPAIELDVDDKEMLEIALIENIQRKDLTPFEESEGFTALQEKFGYTHDRIAQVVGKSRTTITETLL